MLRDSKCSGDSESRTGLPSLWSSNAVHSGHSTPPEIAIQRYPSSKAKVSTEMTLERSDRILIQRRRAWDVKVCRVLGIEPGAAVSVEHPIAPSSGIAEFRFQSPPVHSPVDELGGTVLSGRCEDSQARAEYGLLFPFG